MRGKLILWLSWLHIIAGAVIGFATAYVNPPTAASLVVGGAALFLALFGFWLRVSIYPTACFHDQLAARWADVRRQIDSLR